MKQPVVGDFVLMNDGEGKRLAVVTEVDDSGASVHVFGTTYSHVRPGNAQYPHGLYPLTTTNAGGIAPDPEPEPAPPAPPPPTWD